MKTLSTILASFAILAACAPAPVAATSATSGDAADAVYVCPMHPEVTSAKADDRCTKCGMRLVVKK